MTAILLEPAYWNWLLLGLVLMLIEILVPGTFILWMGIAALGVGLLVLLFPGLNWQWQWLLFAGLTVAAVTAWALYFKTRADRSDDPLLNRRGHQYIGRVFTLETPIVNGQGRLRVDDSLWKVVGADYPAGTRVQVMGVTGVVLQVQAADNTV